MDAFISHASKNAATAKRVEDCLVADGLRVWIDHDKLALGALLKSTLQQAIQDCRVLVLLWSKAAAESRWVAAEALTAFHRDRFIIPCVLDDTPLPVFLAQALHLKIDRGKGSMERLCRAVREAPKSANPLPPRMAYESPELRQAIEKIALQQRKVTDALGQNSAILGAMHQKMADVDMAAAEERWPLQVMVLILAGYHYKNAYMVKHWQAVQAGRGPADPLLLQAERRFLDALFVDPNECSALNGVGSVLILERELDAAEFFVRRAIALAKRDGRRYDAAEHDLRTILAYKRSTITIP
jgi:hypothetical protein